MATCAGRYLKGSTSIQHQCSSSRYKCKKCGNVGCTNNDCPNQGFSGSGSCKKCGSSNKEPVK